MFPVYRRPSMNLYAGTSGYSYKEWKGNFYPLKLPAAQMLRHYAQQLPTVEINNTFYRLPTPSLLASWCEQVPPAFRFAIKAPRRITHIKRLKDAQNETAYLLHNLETLGARLGVILFQLPPYLRKDLARLQAFIDLLPEQTPAAFEFRAQSWFDDNVFEILRARDFALCIADTDEVQTPAIIATASWGYLRLRRAQYEDGELMNWVRQIREQPWGHAYVFFKHEDEGIGPKLAAEFLQLAQ
jgi:uncharacterized protein YecE (DUF72 family)